MIEFTNFVDTLGLTIESTYCNLTSESHPMGNMHRWSVTLKRKGSTDHTLDFHMGTGHREWKYTNRLGKKGDRVPALLERKTQADANLIREASKPSAPELYDVVSCLLSDASCADMTPDDIADEFGYTKPSEAQRVWQGFQEAKQWASSTFTWEDLDPYTSGNVEGH